MEELLRTIKREKLVRLDELIAHVWGNKDNLFKDCKERTFKTGSDKTIIFTDKGLYKIKAEEEINPKDLFLIETVEEITLDTEFGVLINKVPKGDEEPFVDVYLKHSINDVIEADKLQGVETDKIYVLINNEYHLVWDGE